MDETVPDLIHFNKDLDDYLQYALHVWITNLKLITNLP